MKTAEIFSMRPRAELRCNSCGIKADAPCECGAGFSSVKKIEAAAKAAAALPEVSNVGIAERIGVHERTVRRARQPRQNAEVDENDERRTVGRDGRIRRATHNKKPKTASAHEKATINRLIRDADNFRCTYKKRIMALPDLDFEAAAALITSMRHLAEGMEELIESRWPSVADTCLR